MAVKQELNTTFTKQMRTKSFFLFLMHYLFMIVIIGILLIADNFTYVTQNLKTKTGDYVYAAVSIFLLTIILYFYFLFENKSVLASGKMIGLLFTVFDLYIIASFLIGEMVNIYARPVAFVALMMFVLIGRKEAIFLNVVSALLMFIVDTFTGAEAVSNEYYSSLMISFSAGMVAIFLCEKAKTRFLIMLLGLAIVFPIDIIIAMLELSDVLRAGGSFAMFMASETLFMHMGYGVFGGVTSTVFFLALLPVFEIVFNCLTVFRLRELTSYDAKLLKKLKLEAPGTYNHVVMVAQLAEASAAAIGENVDYARAAALYHDVGKLHNPEHFTENQGDYNLHDELTPELSADIIRSHAKDGYSLIRNSHLPEFLADIALQHHGTMPIRYFYAKALKLTDGELNIEDFSYLGPKPQTKLAAIIMIADAAEAAVRATNSRNPESAEKAIRMVIEERMDLEQFSECDITMVDLTKIRLALVNCLTGVYHHRIKYPNIKYKRSEDGKTKGENV
ncbi:MAG: HD domain-containing protein [Clostridia bacterium]|nr:HD domain-containing protein [Clostridia bacterium]